MKSIKTQQKKIQEALPTLMPAIRNLIKEHGLDVHVKGISFGPGNSNCPLKCPEGQICRFFVNPMGLAIPICVDDVPAS